MATSAPSPSASLGELGLFDLLSSGTREDLDAFFEALAPKQFLPVDMPNRDGMGTRIAALAWALWAPNA